MILRQIQHAKRMKRMRMLSRMHFSPYLPFLFLISSTLYCKANNFPLSYCENLFDTFCRSFQIDPSLSLL